MKINKENITSILILLLPTILIVGLIVGLIVWIIFPFLPIPSGSVTGELVSVEVKPMGDFCGSYAWTKVVLNDYVVEGDISDSDNVFYFDGEYYEVEDLTVGSVYKFTYKIGSRPSDTTSGDSITQYYLLGIEKI